MVRSVAHPDIDFTEEIPEYTQIQPHGILLVLSEPEFIVVQASYNVEQFLGITAEELVGQPLSKVIPLDQFQRIQWLLESPVERPIELVKIQHVCFSGHIASTTKNHTF